MFRKVLDESQLPAKYHTAHLTLYSDCSLKHRRKSRLCQAHWHCPIPAYLLHCCLYLFSLSRALSHNSWCRVHLQPSQPQRNICETKAGNDSKVELKTSFQSYWRKIDEISADAGVIAFKAHHANQQGIQITDSIEYQHRLSKNCISSVKLQRHWHYNDHEAADNTFNTALRQ